MSMVRIRSEHAIGFLKGRFQSLKSLRVLILNGKSHKFATYWVAACIGIHNFALKCEEEEQAADEDAADDPFVADGMSEEEENDQDILQPVSQTTRSRRRLQSGKAKRQQLKEAWFRAKARHARFQEQMDTL